MNMKKKNGAISPDTVLIPVEIELPPRQFNTFA